MTDEEKAWGEGFVARTIGDRRVKGRVVVHLGSAGSCKRWPSADAKRILAALVAHGYHCFLFDATGIVDGHIEGVTPVKRVRMGDATAVIAACDAVLCVDAAIYNFGRSLKKRVVPLFGFVPPPSGASSSRLGGIVRRDSSAGYYAPDPKSVVAVLESGGLTYDEDRDEAHPGEIRVFEI
jgi:ADP-heptose:LPS heptosyltransferase